jgi:PAS domain S-box-containing protein
MKAMHLAVFSKWSDDLPFRVKGLFLLIFPLGALLFVVWLISTMASGRRAAEEWVYDSNQVRFGTQKAEMQLLEMETQMGAYLLTGNADLLRERVHSQASLQAMLSQLASVTSSPNARKQLGEIRGAISGERSPLWQVPREDAGQPVQMLGPQARQRFQEQIGLMKNERAQLEAIESEESAFLTLRLEMQEHLYSKYFLTAILIACFCPILGFALNLLLGARITKRLVRLQKFVHLLVHELPMMPVPGGKDEIGQLGKELSVTARALNERERELLRREQQVVDVFDRAPVPLHELDAQGVIRRANQVERDLLGYAPAEILGKHAWDLVSPEQRSACQRIVMSALQGQPVADSPAQDYLRKDGSRIRLSLRLQPLDADHGRVRGVCSVLLSAPGPSEDNHLAAARVQRTPEPSFVMPV